jgi:hypothetical protein
MEKLLIFYLTSNDRYFVFDRFKDELIKSKKVEHIKFLIVNSNPDFSYYESKLLGTNIDYDFAHVECPQNNYLPKVHYTIDYAKGKGINYIMKCDNDVIIPAYTLDFIHENLQKLGGKNLTISPTLSTGIPSVEYFIESLFKEEEVLDIRKEFSKCVFNIQGGIMDYTFLNGLFTDNWEYRKYFQILDSHINSLPDSGNGRTINGYSKFYKGIHPVRHGFGNELINNLIIKYKDNFFKEKECSLFSDPNPYLCNMCFCIKTEDYDDLINKKNLLIDGCDEVPLNRFRWDNGLNHLIVKNGLAIHITYNWRWFLNEIDGGSNISKPNQTLLEYEENFINNLYHDTN